MNSVSDLLICLKINSINIISFNCAKSIRSYEGANICSMPPSKKCIRARLANISHGHHREDKVSVAPVNKAPADESITDDSLYMTDDAFTGLLIDIDVTSPLSLIQFQSSVAESGSHLHGVYTGDSRMTAFRKRKATEALDDEAKKCYKIDALFKKQQITGKPT